MPRKWFRLPDFAFIRAKTEKLDPNHVPRSEALPSFCARLLPESCPNYTDVWPKLHPISGCVLKGRGALLGRRQKLAQTNHVPRSEALQFREVLLVALVLWLVLLFFLCASSGCFLVESRGLGGGLYELALFGLRAQGFGGFGVPELP